MLFCYFGNIAHVDNLKVLKLWKSFKTRLWIPSPSSSPRSSLRFRPMDSLVRLPYSCVSHYKVSFWISPKKKGFLFVCCKCLIFLCRLYIYCLYSAFCQLLSTTSISVYSKFNTRSSIIVVDFPNACRKNGFNFTVGFCICCRDCLISLCAFHWNMEP